MRQRLILLLLLLAPVDGWAHPRERYPFDNPSSQSYSSEKELQNILKELQRELSFLLDRVERDDWMKGHKWLSKELYNLLKDTRSFERGLQNRKEEEMGNALSWMMDKAGNIQRELRKDSYPMERDWDRVFDLVIQLDRRFSRSQNSWRREDDGDRERGDDNRYEERRHLEHVRELARDLERRTLRVASSARLAGVDGRGLDAIDSFSDLVRQFSVDIDRGWLSPFELHRSVTRLESLSREVDAAMRRLDVPRKVEEEWRGVLEAVRRLLQLTRDPRRGLVPLPL